ncbi:MAG TPA: sigma-70 family RNA polymerase sigma factor [Sunxiuqinia sp.]|nr:sigma-70 family RNA polymerase sigma factor [Sunxiuqinia sp.]
MLAKEFKTLVLPLSNKLHRFAIQIMNDEEMARDVIQDVFLKLWQKRDSLGDINNLEAFAMRMTRNKCFDMHRSKRSISIDDNLFELKNESEQQIDREIELSEDAKLIGELIMELPELQQKVIQMRDIQQLEYDEIAEQTGLKLNAIRVNLSRARKKIRDELLKHHGYGLERDQTNTAKIF